MANNNIISTSPSEGEGDSLRTFLCKHWKLKPVDDYYKILSSNGIDYDVLMISNLLDLRETLNEIKMKKVQILHLINALKISENSTIYKQEQKTKTKHIVITLSNQEETALINIKNKNKKICKVINNINININKLNENKKNVTNIINNDFNKIMDIINERKTNLLNELENKSKEKENKLIKQLNEYKIYGDELKKCENESNKLINDISINKEKRKTKILSITSELLNKDKILNIDKFKLLSSTKINVNIDINNIKNVLLKSSNIIIEEPPSSPIIVIKEIKSKSAVITVYPYKENKNVQIEEYKLEYAENARDDNKNDDDEDDMKLDWKVCRMKYNETKKYEIDSLKELTNYYIHAASRNIYGWSLNSKNVLFKTKKEESKLFKFQNGDGFVITNNGLTAARSNQNYGNYKAILFGEFMHNKDKSKFSCVFRLEEGTNSCFGIGFVTPSFTKYAGSNTIDATFMYGNGFFEIDSNCFKCDQRKHASHGGNDYKYFEKEKTVQISIDMETKIAKMKKYTINLPDTVCIAITSSGTHKISVESQQFD